MPDSLANQLIIKLANCQTANLRNLRHFLKPLFLRRYNSATINPLTNGKQLFNILTKSIVIFYNKKWY